VTVSKPVTLYAEDVKADLISSNIIYLGEDWKDLVPPITVSKGLSKPQHLQGYVMSMELAQALRKLIFED
jgi:hypothetical protein